MVKYVKSMAEWAELMEESKSKTVFVDFTASWCPPCRMIGPIFEKIAAQTPSAVFVKVDVDEMQELAGQCGISAMPTFQCYKSGSKVYEMCGASQQKLEAMVAQHA